MAEFRYAVETVDTDPAWFQRFVYGQQAPYDVVPGLSAGQVRVVSSRAVDLRAERWNGSADPNNCTRPATAEEQAAQSIDQRGNLVDVDEFFELFTRPERVGFLQAAHGDDVAVPLVPPDYEVADFLDRLHVRAATKGTINLRGPRVLAGLTMLVDKGLLTQARAVEIRTGAAPV